MISNTKGKITELGSNDNNILFTWDIIGKCNFNCSYCYSKELNKTNKIGEWKLVLSRLKTLKQPFNVELAGGEPTLHPELDKIINELHKNKMCKIIELDTNTTASPELYKKLFKISNKLNISCSYHHEFNSKFVKIYKQIMNDKTFIIFNLPLKLKDVEDALKILEPVKQDIFFNKLDTNKFFKADYDNDIFNKIKFENEEYFDCVIDGKKTTICEQDIFINNNANFKGWVCATKGYSISIDGIITSERDHQILPLSLSNWNFNRTIICPIERCKCGDGFKFKKYNPCAFINT